MALTATPRQDTGTTWPHGTLLQVLPTSCREELLKLGTQREYPDGSVLLREGDTSAHVLLFLKANAKVTASLENGRVALLGIRITGDIVGEMAMLDGDPRSATVTTCGDAHVRVIQRAECVEFLRSCPEANMAISGMISRRLRWANRRRVDFNGYKPGVRLARILVELAEAHGHDATDGIAFHVTLTHYELGAFVGADPDTIGKELRRLRAQRVIHSGYKKIVICDLGALKTLAHMSD